MEKSARFAAVLSLLVGTWACSGDDASDSGSSGGASSAGASNGGATSHGGVANPSQGGANSGGAPGVEGGRESGVGGTFSSAGGTTSGGANAQAGTAGSSGGEPASSRGGSTHAGGAGANASGGSTSRGGSPSNGGTSNGGGSNGGTGNGGTGNGGANGGATGGVSICNFASGLNIAWVDFAKDVPNPNIATFNTIFKNSHDAGGRVIRWWFHTNGTTTPGYDANGLAVKLPQSHIDGVKAILSAAQQNGVRVTLVLWSFDMLQDNAMSAWTNNQKLLEVDANRQAYIDNYLTPLVNAIKGHPGLYAWEIFNEPEGMGPKGWATHRTTEAAIQKTVNWLSAAIHSADPTALVTNGAQTFDYCSSVSGKANLYSDAALRAAGGKQNGTLDFYQVHYYTANGASNSPFTRPARYWGLDKKLVIGEFFTRETDGVAANALYTNLYDSGYSGAWAWSYNADEKWPSMQAPMQALFTAHADVGACP